MSDIVVDARGVSECIDRLPNHVSPGCDNVNVKLLKLTKCYIVHAITDLFNHSLNLAVLPRDWLHANIIPVHKSGSVNKVENYRPISLTSIVCKILEHIICSNMMTFLESNGMLSRYQHEFRKNFSCVSQLFEFSTDLHNSVHERLRTDAVFIDFRKAFDKVCHQGLLHKLRRLNINTKVTNWVEAFLTGRSQCVVFGNETSTLLPVISGVPQGTVLGPILFLVYINDLPECISANIRLYADDCVIHRNISCTDDSVLLQTDLNNISKWCLDWGMEINVSKTKHFIYNTEKPSSI